MKSVLCCLTLALLFSGCATSGVAPMGGNSYMITRHVWGFTGPSPIKAELLKQADEYCRSHGKVLLVTKTVEIGLKFGGEPAAEVYFKALDPNDPALKNPPVIEEIVR
ncbi:MAG TPA: hypothetical protein VHE61_15865 [Opitutaceae bacterium]|nr:hypothetical protein [Opitutaceae bacterium]